MFIGAWDPATESPKEIQAITEAVHLAANPIRAFAPDGGAYQNEVSIPPFVLLERTKY